MRRMWDLQKRQPFNLGSVESDPYAFLSSPEVVSLMRV